MNEFLKLLLCARRIKYLHRYDLLSQSWKNVMHEKYFGDTYESTNQVKVVFVSNIDILIDKMAWPQCDLLKLDLQGGELSALRGAEK